MKTITVAMIGSANAAKSHVYGFTTMPLFYNPAPVKINLKVFCDTHKDAALTGMKRYGFEEYSTNWEKVVSRPDIDLIDICTSKISNREIAVASAEAGKIIYCENPLSRNLTESIEMYTAAEKAGVRTAVGFEKRRFQSIKYAKKLIDQGYIGKPVHFHGTYIKSNAAEDDNIESLYVMKCHIIDLSRYLFGEYSHVSAVKDKINKNYSNKEITRSFSIKFSNGAIGNIELLDLDSNRRFGFELYGTEGSIIWNGSRGTDLQIMNYNDPPGQQGYKIVEMCGEHADYFWPFFGGFGFNWGEIKAIEIHDLLNAFINKEPFSPNFKDAVRTAEICDALSRSADEEGKWIETESLID